MKYRIIFLLLTTVFMVTFLSPVSAQVNSKGNPIIFSYDYGQTGGSEWNHSIVKDYRGIYYFGNEIQGVLEFDGKNWKPIRINNNPVIYAVEKDRDGIIYAAGPYEFGFLEPNASGDLEYVSLSARLDSVRLGNLSDVYDIQYFEENVYFASRKTVYKYNSSTDVLDSLHIPDDFFTIQRLYSLNDRLIISDNREGLLQMVGDSVEFLPGGQEFGRDYCFSILPYDSTSCLVGTYLNGLHLYNFITGEISRDFLPADINEELRQSQIYNGIVLSDGNFAFGTMSNGVYIFDRSGRLLEQYSNETLGLHDDQVYYTYQDGSKAYSSFFWMTVVEKIYRIAYNLPIRKFDEQNNINYPIRDVIEFNDNIYIAGDQGVAKKIEVENKAIFEKLDGIGSQTYFIVPFMHSAREKFMLTATLDGLYIIDGDEKVELFFDIIRNPQDSFNPLIQSIIVSDFKDGRIYLGSNRRLTVVEYSNRGWDYLYTLRGFSGEVNSIVEESSSKIWVNTVDMNKLFTVNINDTDTIISEYIGPELDDLVVQSVKKIDGSIILVTDKSIFEFNHELEKFEIKESFMLNDNEGITYEDVQSLGDWGVFVSASDYRNFDYIVRPDGSKVVDIFYLMPKSFSGYFMEKDNTLWLPKQQEIYLLDLDRIGEYEYVNDVLIRKVMVGGDSTLFNGAFFEETEGGIKKLVKHQPKSQVPKINHSLNDITFSWSSTNLMSGDSTFYSFMIEGFDKDWSRWESVNYKDYTNLQHGKYKFKIKAKGLTRHETEVTVYEFEILRAWYQSFIAIVIYIMLAILSIVGIIKVYTRRLINENVRLEGIVAERTKEVVRQKEELEDSIHYASRIQRAILPSEKALKDKVEEYFILFRPRDIVSGDFYWVSEKGSRLYIVAADCTGHGVPGAFMSILGISFLDEIVNKAENTETDKILNILRKHVTDSLKQMEESDEETKDGMDMGILVVNYEKNEIEYSGAYNPCWVVRQLSSSEKEKYLSNELEMERTSVSNGEYILETIDADRMPIGISSRMDQPFKMKKQKLEKGVSYYLLSDGYSDQFGGKNGRKFLKKNLKKLILEVQGLPMKQQRDLLEKRLVDWMGDQEQVDDILIMGVRVM